MTQDNYPESDADRRIYPRSPVVVKEARCISGMDVFFGYASNISLSGLFIATSKHREEGTEHDIHFSLPGVDKEFACKARVVWNRPYKKGTNLPPGFGLTFIDLSEEDGKLIDEWVGVQPPPKED